MPNFNFPKSNTYWVALSGGMDSIVLLHQLSQTPLTIKAIHINHGLSPHADEWQAFCLRVCKELNVECVTKKVDVNKNKNIEASAREARYAAFKSLMIDDDCLITAHHKNDQAETLLLQLFRGAGPKGLGAMQALRKFHNGHHARPFLKTSREELEAYAFEHHLIWIEDESNQNTDFDRNYVRHELMPKIQNRWPEAVKTITRSALLSAEAADLLDELAEIDFVSGKEENTLSIANLLNLSDSRRRNLIRYWLNRLSLPIPSANLLNHITSDVLYSNEDAMPLLSWEGVEIRKYRDDLFAMKPLPDHDSTTILEWEEIKDGKLTIRFRNEGERLGSRPLKKLFQEWGVPPWKRDRIPLIYLDDKLIAVVGYGAVKIPSLSPS